MEGTGAAVDPGLPGQATLVAPPQPQAPLQPNPPADPHPEVELQEVTVIPQAPIQEENDDELKDQSHDAEDAGEDSGGPLSPRFESVRQEWQAYLELRKKSWPKVPDVFIRYQDLGYNVEIPKRPQTVENVFTTLRRTFVDRFKKSSRATKTLQVLEPVSGCITPGRMTLILAEPGGGKSTFLRLLAGQAPQPKSQLGQVFFNGKTQEELDATPNALKVSRAVAYVDQEDNHLSLLTVKETLDFAREIQSIEPHWIAHPELVQHQRNKVEQMIHLLGLTECADTIVGNNIIRGISGGQKKRLTLAEMLMGEARVLLLDEVTNGLDAAVAFDILSSLRAWVLTLNTSIVAALLQPTPEVYELFDDIILLRGGRMLYHGPRTEVPAFMQRIGIPVPDHIDEADFLTEFLINSQYVAKKYGRPRKEEAAGQEAKQQPESAEEEAGGPSVDVGSAAIQAVYRDTRAFAELCRATKEDELVETDMRKLGEYACRQYGQSQSRTLFEQTKLCLDREFMVMKRDRGAIIPRIVQTIFMSLVLGTVFWDLDPEMYFSRFGLMLYALLSVSFGNMVELPTVMEGKAVFVKHHMAGLLRVPPYVMSVDASRVVLRITETLIMGSVIYWMTGFAPDAGRFFSFLVIVLATSFCMSAYFRTISSSVPNQSMAQLLAGPSVMTMMVFAGFVISRDTMPEPFLALYWISPISWAMRALALIEFKDPGRYGETMIQNGEPIAQGDWYLESMEFYTEEVLVWVALAVLILYFVLLSFATNFALKRARRHQPGTQRLSVTQEDPNDENELFRRQTPRELRRSDRDGIAFRPVNLVWKDLYYDVVLPDGSTRTLLRGASGHCTPGTLTAMLGASGAGKSTLMDVIAGRKTGGKIKGEIMVNGEPKDDRTFGRIAGYVEQQDIHDGASTVREALMFAANLRLPSSLSKERKVAMVEEVLELLELKEIQHRMIGDENIVGLAPGERKRVTIGVELVANPSVLFLDEPTTGIDSRAALEVVRVLRRISATGRSVLCTIHQPSTELFSHFDRLLLLGTGGRQVYFGTNEHIKPYFEAIPNVPPCGRQNPATWVINVVGSAAEDPEETSKVFAEHYERSDLIQFNREEVNRLAQTKADPLPGQDASAVVVKEKRYATSVWNQFLALQLRITRSLFRSVQFTLSRFTVLLIVGIMFGLVYYNVGENVNSFAKVNSVVGLIYITATFNGVLFCTTSLPYLFEQRAVFYREVSSNTYSRWIYGPSLIFPDFPYVLLGTLLYLTPLYWLAGLENSGRSFLMHYLAQICLVFPYVYIGQMLSSVLPNLVTAGIAQGMVLSFTNLFGGLFIFRDDIPDPWIWMYYINPIPKAIRSLMITQLGCDAGPDCPTMEVPGQGQVFVHEYLEKNFSYSPDEYWEYIWQLAVTMVAFLTVILLALGFLNHLKR